MNAQTVDAIATARLGGLLEPQVARLQVRLMAEMVEQLGTLAGAGLGGAKLVTVADDAAFAALTSAEVNVGDFVYLQSSAVAPYIADCILQLVTAGSEGVLVGYAVLGNASAAWLSEFLAASTAAAAAVAIVNGNPINPGILTFTQNNASPVVVSSASSTSGFGSISGNPSIWSGGTLIARMSNGSFAITSGLSLGSNPSAPDVYIYGAANTWSQRNGTSPQINELYGTYTSTTNYERLKMCYNSGTTSFQIGTEKGSGGGSARGLEILINGTKRLEITSTGAIIPVLPTSAAGLPTGALWNNGGVVNVA